MQPNILITNLREAKIFAGGYDSVLTAGPGPTEVNDFKHPDHKVVQFHDTLQLKWDGATEAQVADVLDWAKGRKDNSLLVHCHAGMSRSTSMTVGILASWGYSEEDAWEIAKNSRPASADLQDRPFIPNPLVLSHIDALLGTNFMKMDARHELMLASGYFDESWGE